MRDLAVPPLRLRLVIVPVRPPRLCLGMRCRAPLSRDVLLGRDLFRYSRVWKATTRNTAAKLLG